MIFQHAYSSSGSWVAGAPLATQDARWDPCWTGCPSTTGPHMPTPTAALSQTGVTQAGSHLTYSSVGCGRKREDLKKTCADMGEHVNSTQAVASTRTDFCCCCLLINIIRKMLNKMTIFKDLPYFNMKFQEYASKNEQKWSLSYSIVLTKLFGTLQAE